MALQLFSTGFQDPFFADFERSMTRAFQPFFGPLTDRSMGLPAAHSNVWHPMDIVESQDKFSIKADVPGLTPEDVHVELKDRVLTVSGEKKLETEHTDEQNGVRIYRKERTFNKFYRSFVLPDDTLVDGITAKIDNGVLTLDIPKKPAEPAKLPEPKKIPVLTNTPTTAAIAIAPSTTPSA